MPLKESEAPDDLGEWFMELSAPKVTYGAIISGEARTDLTPEHFEEQARLRLYRRALNRHVTIDRLRYRWVFITHTNAWQFGLIDAEGNPPRNSWALLGTAIITGTVES